MDTPRLSVLVPVHCEEDNILELTGRLLASLEDVAGGFEVIFVDDASTDDTADRLLEARALDPRVHVLTLASPSGICAALMAGIDSSRGEVVATIDGDLQNPPEELPRMLSELGNGFDLVLGWRRKREDVWLTRTLPSQIAARLISHVTGVPMHDFGIGLRVFRRSAMGTLRLREGMHRFFPVLLSRNGARVRELQVDHDPRVHGRSKFGLERIPKVLLDLLVLQLFENRNGRPIYSFGALFFVCAALAFSMLLVGATPWFRFLVGGSLGLLFLLVLQALTLGTAFLFLGLLGELIVVQSLERNGGKNYVIRTSTLLEGSAASDE